MSPTYLVESAGSVVGEGNNLANVVARVLDRGYTQGRIYNQHNNASMDLAEWVEENQTRLLACGMED